MLNFIDVHTEIHTYEPKIHKDACICMIDICNFSSWCAKKSPSEIFSTMINYNHFLSRIMSKYKYLDKIELVGDSVLIVSSLETDNDIHSRIANVVDMSANLLNNLDTMKSIFDHSISVRIGINVGDIYSGFIKNPTKFQIFGNSINIASRLESNTFPGTYSISERAFKLINNLNEFPEIGKKKSAIMKGVGLIDFRIGFLNKAMVLVADDDSTCVEVFKKMIQLRYNLGTQPIYTIIETFKTMKENTYTLCILDIHFVDSCVLGSLREFRDWESIYRKTRQKIYLTSFEIDENVMLDYSNLIEGYIDKDKIYCIDSYPVIESV